MSLAYLAIVPGVNGGKGFSISVNEIGELSDVIPAGRRREARPVSIKGASCCCDGQVDIVFRSGVDGDDKFVGPSQR